VLVFGAAGRLVGSLSVPDRAPGAFREGEALGLDHAGRLYIFDGRAQRVLVYQ